MHKKERRQNSLLPGGGIREEPGLRRVIGEPQEAGQKDADKAAQQNAIGLSLAGQGEAAGNPERNQDAQKKGAEIQKEQVPAQDKGIAIV